MGAGSGGRGDPAAPGWHRGTSQDGTLRMGQFGRWGASVRAHGLARGVCVRACERQCVLEHSCQSFSDSAAPGLHTGSGLLTP